ncbi:TadE family protein [Streptomyces rhizosphaerihabitans]|uniref:TadE family protein n=1 Tax=Streptomyces rhizosphaerihabitans TaxID=1266770 RepID=UPI0021C0EB35|nr:TadE family protein [Streptomyces rhizosphaerihabitans]MCT9003797.1 pilus assembly protein [Streptomyces rhizosphaerihabitans]
MTGRRATGEGRAATEGRALTGPRAVAEGRVVPRTQPMTGRRAAPEGRAATGVRAVTEGRATSGRRAVTGRRPAGGFRGARRLRGDRGVSILEFVGFLPILLLIGMAVIQLGLIGYGANQAGSGARAAARVASQGGDGGAAGQAAVSGWLNPRVPPPAKGPDLTTATVTVHVPGVIPLFPGYDLTRRATMPTDD